MREYIHLFETHENYEDFVESGEMLRPNVSHCVQENEVHYNPVKRYIPTPGLSNEEDIVKLANLYIEEHNITEGTNFLSIDTIGKNFDGVPINDNCSTFTQNYYVEDLIENNPTNLLKVPSPFAPGKYIFYFPESGCCKIEWIQN